MNTEFEVKDKPTIVCLCGSTKFPNEFGLAARSETLKGNIVLSVGFFSHAENVDLSPATKTSLMELHKRKIAMADEILVINPGGYVGEGLKEELAYANNLGKVVRWLYPFGQE